MTGRIPNNRNDGSNQSKRCLAGIIVKACTLCGWNGSNFDAVGKLLHL
jgi:hypothetical protein